MEEGPLIDITVEDDLLITAAVGSPTMPSSETNVHQKEHLSKICKQAEQISEFSESLERKSSKSRNVDSRKSLTWDSEFFTSEGILDAEELAIVNGTFAKAEACKLPRIHEDARKPTESTSNLDLESLEVDLFQDFRASIQESLGKCDKASYDRREQGGLDESHIGPPKKIETSSRNKMKHNNTLRRHVPSTQHAYDTSKEVKISLKKDASGIRSSKSSLSRATTLPTMSGKKASVSGSIQTKSNNGKSLPGSRIGNSANQSQSLARTGRVNHSRSFNRNSSTEKDDSGTGTSKSLLKPRVIAPRASTLPSMPEKKASNSRSIQTKGSIAMSLSGNAGKQPSNASLKISGDLSSVTLRPAPLKSALGTQLISVASSSSSSSDHSHKSLESLRKRSSRTSHHPSEPTTKTITRRSRSKIGSNDSDGSTHPMISRSSSVSSNSSLGSVVTRSSSSTSVSVVKPYKLSTDLRPSRNGQDPATSGSENRTRNLTSSTTGAKCFKPSGLKMPTPKIGFFDAEKSTIHNSSQFSHTGLRNNLPKNTGNTNTIEAKKLKPSTLPSLKSAALRALNTSATKPPTPVSLHTLSKSTELCDPPALMKDDALCSRVEMDLSPINREDHHLEIPKIGRCVLNKSSRLTNLNEEKASYSNSKHSVPKLIEKENLSGIDSSSGLVELISQGISSMSLSEKKDPAITGDL